MKVSKEVNEIYLGFTHDIISMTNESIINNKKEMEKIKMKDSIQGENAIDMDSGFSEIKIKYKRLDEEYKKLLSDEKNKIKLVEKNFHEDGMETNELKKYSFDYQKIGNHENNMLINLAGIHADFIESSPIYNKITRIESHGGKAQNSGMNYGIIQGGNAYKIIKNIININVFISCFDFSISMFDGLVSMISGMIGQRETAFGDQTANSVYELNKMFIIGQNHSEHLLK